MEISDLELHVEEMSKLFGDDVKYLVLHYPIQFGYYWNLYQFYKNRSSGTELIASE